jgi:uncharacterized protein (TIGR02217 family)
MVAVFNANWIRQYPSSSWRLFNTLCTRHSAGALQLRRAWEYPLHYWRVHFNVLAHGDTGDLFDSQMGKLYNFYLAMGGSATPFYFKDSKDFQSATDEAIGTGDGSTVTFQLKKAEQYPYDDSTTESIEMDKKYIIPDSQTVKVAGVTKTESVDYTLDDDTGVVDFTLMGAPTLGQAITCTFQYYYRVHFLEDNLTFEEFNYQACTLGLTLEEVW